MKYRHPFLITCGKLPDTSALAVLSPTAPTHNLVLPCFLSYCYSCEIRIGHQALSSFSTLQETESWGRGWKRDQMQRKAGQGPGNVAK